MIQIKICAMPAFSGHGTYKRGVCRLKKFFCLILVFLILLCGCTQQSNTASKPLAQNNTDSSPTQNLHMLHSSDEKAGKKAKTNDGLYFVELRNDDSNGSNLLYLDYATRQAVVVCEKPDCLHSDETCTAFFPYRYGAANSCVVGNYLYIIFSGSEKENILPALYRIDLNGQNRTQLATLPSEFDYNNPVATDGEKLYTVCNRIEAEENGRIRTFTNLISLSLQDGALQTLREWDCDAYLWGAEGSTLSVMLPVDAKEASVSFNIELISSSGELLATQPFQNITPRYYVTENTIYWYSLEDGSIYARRLDSSEEQQIATGLLFPDADDVALINVYYPYIFLDHFTLDTGGKYHYEVYNVENGELHEVDLFLFETPTDNKLIPVYDKIGDFFLVGNREIFTETTGFTSDGQAVTFESMELVQAFISIDDFLNSRPNYEEVKMP